MALSTVLALGAALIVVGLLTQFYPVGGGLSWVAGGVVAIVVGWATKGMK